MARPSRRGSSLHLPEADRLRLERWARAGSTPQRLALRSQIVLALGEGLSARAVARKLGVARHTVDLWRKRYEKDGCEALVKDKPGRGRKPKASDRCSVAHGWPSYFPRRV